MNPSWTHNARAVAFLLILLGSGLASSLTLAPAPAAPQAAPAAERAWEGGGSRTLFVDTLDQGLAGYLEKMRPLPGDAPFGYYGGAIPSPDPGEVPGLWHATRWRHEPWRWGEESVQSTFAGVGEVDAWSQADGVLGFGDQSTYLAGAFSAAISPVVDLRGVEPIGRGADVAASLRDPADTHPTLVQMDAAVQAVSQTGVVEASRTDAAIGAPPAHNASAALRLRHAYGFVADPDSPRDGARLEVSSLDPVQGWLDWQPLAPSANGLRVGEEELQGRYAAPLGGVEAGAGASPPPGPDGTPAAPDAYVRSGLVAQNVPARPWAHQGTIEASRSDRRGGGAGWEGFGGFSGGLVESVFDLTPHAGHLVRFRFVAATLGQEETNQGLGWVLDQVEVHATGAAGLEILAPVTPGEGAILGKDADPPLTVAIQNTRPEAVTAHLRVGIEGAGSVAGRATLPPGPWGRVFHTFDKSLRDLAPKAAGLQHLTVAATELPDLDRDVDVMPPAPSAEGRFHFQLGGPQPWRPVRVVTEAVPLGPDDGQTRPGDRVVRRGQAMRIHVDLENLGPEPIALDFSGPGAPLRPRLLDPFSNQKGEFAPPGDGDPAKGTVVLPPSREASGSLGDAQAVRRVSWNWTGTRQATILDLAVDRVQEDGSLLRALDGGTVRVETMEPRVLSVDFSNRWAYVPAGQTGCRRTAGDAGHSGILACLEGGITSPVEPVHPTDLRRGDGAHLFLAYKGEGSVTVQANDADPDGSQPGAGAAWQTVKVLDVAQQADWTLTSFPVGALGEQWRGWVRVLLHSDAGLQVDELRLEVGPPDRRLPLLWEAFAAGLDVETTGALRSASEGKLAVLHGAAARVSEVADLSVSVLSRELVNSEGDETTLNVSTLSSPIPFTVDTKASGVSTFQLPGTYTLDGARPTLRFRHWLAPSASATGAVEAARVDASLPEGVPTRCLDWEPVAEFPAPLHDEAPTLKPAAVPLWPLAGETVCLRFRYQYDTALQPNNAPPGWVLDAVSLDRVPSVPGQKPVLHSADKDYTGYALSGVNFVDQVEGARRAAPAFSQNVGARPGFWFGNQHASAAFGGPDSVCASAKRPSTYGQGQSIITDPLDLRALAKPVLVLEHGGRWTIPEGGRDHVNRFFGQALFDIEYQVLDAEGKWGPWQRSTPFGATLVPDGSAFMPLAPFLKGPAPLGALVTTPFTNVTWGTQLVPGTTSFSQIARVDLLDDKSTETNEATVFSLSGPGPAGEIARFRFHHWEEKTGGACPTFEWFVYSMQVYEGTHLFDTALTSIALSTDDRPQLERAGAAGGLDADAAVVAGDAVSVDVHTRNGGSLSHLSNVTLVLLREDGTPVPGTVRFVDRSAPGPGRLTAQNHGKTPLQKGQEADARFRVDFSLVPPGTYLLRAVGDIDDALDTNPKNDVATRQVRVVALRELKVDAGAGVDPAAGTPEDRRLLSVEVRNLGNVPDRATVHAKVVELLGVGREADIGPLGPDGRRTPYTLLSRSVEDLPARSGSARLTWDLVGDHHGGLHLEDLLVPGLRYGVNVTLFAAPSLEAWWAHEGMEFPYEKGSQAQGGDADLGRPLAQPPGTRSIGWVPQCDGNQVYSPPGDCLFIDMDDNHLVGVGDVVLNNIAGGDMASGDTMSPGKAGCNPCDVVPMSPGAFNPSFLDLYSDGTYGPDDTVVLDDPASQGAGLGSLGFGDVYLSGPRFGAVETNNVGSVLHPLAGHQACFVEMPDGAPGFDRTEPVYLAPNCAQGVSADSVRISNPLAGPLLSTPTVPRSQVFDLGDPGTRCGCSQVAFFVEDELAASDLTPAGTRAKLDGYVGGPESWQRSTAVRIDGAWQEASEQDRPDLPHWALLNRSEASAVAGAPGKGNAWHLPAYTGFDRLRHTLTSPPLPGHVIGSASQAILDLRYASGATDEAKVEVRTLLPGGTWSEWGPVDGLRAQRVAVVLPPDYPQVFSNRVTNHPIPPFYKADVVANDNVLQTWTPDANGDYVGVVDAATVTNAGCNTPNPAQSPLNCRWSPFPMFQLPGQPGHTFSLQTLATVLQTLADRLGPDNVNVFTTFPEGGGFGEFGVPAGQLGALGVELDTTGIPLLRVASGNGLLPHELPILGLDDLGRNLGTYGALLVLGDGLTRYAAGNGLSATMGSLSLGGTLPDSYLADPRITLPTQGITTPELDRHFDELLQILRFAPGAGVQVVGGLGPAPASIGLSGIAQNVPLALWLPRTTPGTPAGVPLPLQLNCLVDSLAPPNQFTAGSSYSLNFSVHPKPVCRRVASPFVTFFRADYAYAAAADAQATVLRQLLAQGGGIFAGNFFQGISPACGGTLFSSACVQPLAAPLTQQGGNGVRFVTAAQEPQAQAWANAVLGALNADGVLPAGLGAWQDLPLSLGMPVGGAFQPGPDGRPNFVGETMQFRITVQSDPAEAGHGLFLLGGFRLLGTPLAEPDLQVRIADPTNNALRDPGEPFYVTAEVLNRGLGKVNSSRLDLRMQQVPGGGACGGECPVFAFYPPSSQDRTLQVPELGPGERAILTVRDPATRRGADAQAESEPIGGIQRSWQGEPFNDGRFPSFPPGAPDNAQIWFTIEAQLKDGPAADGFAARNDANSALAVGRPVANFLVKNPQQDVRVTPNQALHVGAAQGDPGAGALPTADSFEVQVRLTNDGSHRTQVGDVQVQVVPAMPYQCRQVQGGGPVFSACGGPGGPGNPPLPLPGFQGFLNGLEVPRGATQQHNLSIGLAQAGLPPGVYAVQVRVTSAGLPAQDFQRWIYLGDGDGRWRPFYQEDLATVQGNADVSGANAAPWGTTTDGAGGPFFQDATTPCRPDPTATAGDGLNGVPLVHGWRFSSASDDVCAEFRDPGSHALHWVRDPQPSYMSNAWSVSQTLNTQPTATDPRGQGDFGPDAVYWYPGDAESQMTNGIIGDGVPESLADFAPSTAALVLDTRFQATPNTAYVVEMQVPIRVCAAPPQQGPGQQGVRCTWNWNWGGLNPVNGVPNDSQHWFPLQAIGGVTRASPAMPASDGDGTPNCVAPQNGPARCSRPRPSNPLSGLVGVWGGDSAQNGADALGWTQVRYPINPAFQTHAVPAFNPYTGLNQYCSQLPDSNPNNFPNLPPAFQQGFRACMYALSNPTLGSGGNEIPRPVAFRLRAASHGGDAGANNWEVRSLTLTAHNLQLDGAATFTLPFTDGDLKVVPVELRNAGPVDDVVAVAAQPTFPLDGLDVGMARAAQGAPAQQILVPIPSGESRTVYAHLHFGYGAGGLSPGDEHEIPVAVRAWSVIAPRVQVQATVNALLTPLHRADLVVDAMVADGTEAGTVDAAEGVPVDIALRVRNEGSRPVDGDPVLVRLLAKELDPEDRSVLGVATVAEAVATDTFTGHCRQPRCSVPVNLRWTPAKQGLFELVAQVNLPHAGDAVAQVPESALSNNEGRRLANAGAVPLADLRVLDLRAVPFDGGCLGAEDQVTRLIAGHSYCLAAHVTNQGRRAAVDPVAGFSIGASEFSKGQEPGLPDPLEGSASAWVFSAPLRAILLPAGAPMEFQVQLDTASPTASVEAKGRTLRLPVDGYGLELLAGDVPGLHLEQGGEATLALRLLNTGTAVATPTVRSEGVGGVRVHLVQPPPLQPGEEAPVTLVLRAGLGAAEGRHELQAVFSTVEDRLVRVPLPLRPSVGGNASAAVLALPLRAAPGNATLELAIDNSAWARNGTWALLGTTGPLDAPDKPPLAVAGHGVAVRGLTVTVRAHTPPGEHAGLLRLRASHGAASSLLEVPYRVQVLPAPALAASLAEANLAVQQGVEPQLSILLANPGNVPVEATLQHSVDSGSARADATGARLEPGANRTIALTLRPGDAGRSLGQTTVQWRGAGNATWRQETLLWSVLHTPGAVRIGSTDLAGLRVRAGEEALVRAFLLNPGKQPLQAEAVLVVDGLLHSVQRTDLAAGATQPVDLPLRLDAGSHTVQVLARPAGAQVGLSDPVFHAVGDAASRDVEVSGDSGFLSVPVPAAAAAILALLGAAFLRRRRA